MSTRAQICQTLLAGLEFGGVTASGYVAYFVTAGTGPSIASLKTIYLDEGKASPAANPYTLDADGRAVLYLDGSYDVVIKTAVGGAVKATWQVRLVPDILAGMNVDSRDATAGDVNVAIVAANDAAAAVQYIGKSLLDVSGNKVIVTPASGTIDGLATYEMGNSGEYKLLIPVAADNNYSVK